MESIKALREVCQAPRRKTDNWHMKNISRKVSIYVTWALLHTRITPNQTTFLMTVIGLAAGLIFLYGSKLAFLIGALILEFWYVLDMVDGEIARYRKQTSVTGVFLDSFSHYIVHPFIFFCIGMGLYRGGSGLHILILAILGGYSVCMITIIADVFNSVMYIKGGVNSGISNDEEPRRNTITIFKKAFSILHLICTFPSIMNILFLVTVANFFIPYNLLVLFIVFYAVAATSVWTTRCFVFVITRKPDIHFNSLIEH